MSTSKDDARSLSSQADYTDAYQSHGEQYSELRSALMPPLTMSPQDVRKDPEEDSYLLSEMYVKHRMSELRVMTNTAGKKMYSYASDLYEDLITFVQGNFLYLDGVYAPNKVEEGTKVKKRLVPIDEEMGNMSPPKRRFDHFGNPTPSEDWQYHKHSVLGDRHCLWRTIAFQLCGDELAWQSVRLIIMHYARNENPMLYNIGGISEHYLYFVCDDLNSKVPEVLDETRAPYVDWEFMPELLEAAKGWIQPGMLEAAIASMFFGTEMVMFVCSEVITSDDGLISTIKARAGAVVSGGVFRVDYGNKEDKSRLIPDHSNSMWIIQMPTGDAEVGHWDPITIDYMPVKRPSKPPPGLAPPKGKSALSAFTLSFTGKGPQQTPKSTVTEPLRAPKSSPPLPMFGGKSGQPPTFGSPSPPAPESMSATIQRREKKVLTSKDALFPLQGKAPSPVPDPKSFRQGTLPKATPATEKAVEEARIIAKDKAKGKKGRGFDELLFETGLGKGKETPKLSDAEKFAQAKANSERLVYEKRQLQKKLDDIEKQEQEALRKSKVAERVLCGDEKAADDEALRENEEANKLLEEAATRQMSAADYLPAREQPSSPPDKNAIKLSEVGYLFGDEADEDADRQDAFAQDAGYADLGQLEHGEYDEQRRLREGPWSAEEWEHYQEGIEQGEYDEGSQPEAEADAGKGGDHSRRSPISGTDGDDPSKNPGETLDSGGAGDPGGGGDDDRGQSKKLGAAAGGGDDDPPDPWTALQNLVDALKESNEKKAGSTKRAYYEDMDEKAGAEVSFSHKLTHFAKDFAVGKLRQLDRFISETHIVELLKTFPQRPDEVMSAVQWAKTQHKKAVSHPDAKNAILTFQAPDTSKLTPFQLNWRTKYMAALLEILPQWVKDDLYDLCRKHGKFSTSRNLDDRQVTDVFAPENTTQHMLVHSEFYCIEAAYFLLYCSGYSGRNYERTAIQKYIAPPFGKEEKPNPIGFSSYESTFKAWQEVIAMAIEFSIELPDPQNMFTMYEYKLLGSGHDNGVLSQFKDLNTIWSQFRIDKNVTDYRCTDEHRQKVRNDISFFHLKVIPYLRHQSPDHKPPASKKDQTPAAKQFSQGKGDKKGKGKGKGKDGKKGGKGKKGKGKGKDSKKGGEQAPAQASQVYTKEQLNEYYSEIMQDGYRRGLCWSYCLDGKCKFLADSKPCPMQPYGGHPAKATVTAEMIAVVTARRDRYKAGFKKKKSGNGGNAQQPAAKPPGPGPYKGGGKNNWAPRYAAAMPYQPPAVGADWQMVPDYVNHAWWAAQGQNFYQQPQAVPFAQQPAQQAPPALPAPPQLAIEDYTINMMHDDRKLVHNQNASPVQKEQANARIKAFTVRIAQQNGQYPE